MKKYYDFKEQNKKQLNKFIDKNVFFAFSNEQFYKGLEKLNLTKDNYKNKISSLYGGGFILSCKVQDYRKILNLMRKHERKYLSTYTHLVDAIEYEMSNHECGYTGDYSQGLYALGYTENDLSKNKKLQKAYITARHKVYDWYMQHG